MYLKSLTLHGFKSFADKTTFEFSTGVTGIVGPNGCGKSNVVDAIRWVLGETSAKALRGDEMADVIFNGTDKRKPVGMAEVTLTMADCEQALKVDFNEMSLTRRVFRDGRSEYRLNNTLCRLRDFHDLLAGTGIGRAAYSIMAQGQIDMLLSSKPEDRRSVFEEAAGITKFKGQKKEALRKLEYTEVNLLRIADIVAEVKRQMGTVQRQAQKARRYQILLTDQRTLDTHLGHKHWSEYSAEKTETETLLTDLLLRLNDAHKLLHNTEREASETREAYHAIEGTLNTLRAQAQEMRTQVQAAESKMGFNRERSEELEGRIRKHDEDIANAQELIEQQQREMATADEQLNIIRANIEGRQLALNEHQGGHQSLAPQRGELDNQRRAVRESIRMYEGQLAASESRIQSLTTQIAADRQRHEALQRDLQSSSQAREAAQIEYDDLQHQLTDLEAARNELDEQLKAIASGIVEKRRQRDTLDTELNELQRTATQRRSRLEVLQQLIQKGEGLDQGTQQVLRGLDNPDIYMTGVRGLLASAIEVEQLYITAVEAAMREHLQAVLLTESELAMQIVERLAQQKMGKTAIIAQDFAMRRQSSADISPVSRGPLPHGAIAWAVDKVKAREGTQGIVEHLLAHTLIADSLHSAMRIKRQHPDLAIATMQGEFISETGVIYGGASKEEATSTLRREAEVRTLVGEVEALEMRLLEKEDVLATLRHDLEDQQREEATLREQSQHTREQFSQYQGKLSVVQRALQQASAKADSVDWEQSQLGERMAAAEANIISQREQAAQAAEAVEGARAHEQELEIEADSIARREMESSERLGELRIALAHEMSSLQALEGRRTPIARRMSELLASIQRYEHEILTWRERLGSSEAENESLAMQIEEKRSFVGMAEEELATQTAGRMQFFERVGQLEQQLSALRLENTAMTEQRSKSEVQLTRVDLRLENLTAQLQERYQLDPAAFVPDLAALEAAIEGQRKGRGRRASAGEAEDSNAGLPSATVEPYANTEQATDDQPTEVVWSADAEPAEDEGDSEWKDARSVAEEINEPEAPAATVDPYTSIDWNYVTLTVADLRQRLDGIGSVNLDAIQEFEELEQRYTFLDGQFNDLTKSKDELLQVIAKINDTTKAMFVETFNLVRGYFQNNFAELFGETSKADLLLVNEDDPLESGIEIIAKPPGKKLQTISLLSGGERSMTAVALLFSIYQVKPSPFCVLDELDAPLDESNISRFLKMLENFIGNSQFIIVTHNKRTMGRADVIYGVTMQERGVSKPVGVRMTTEANATHIDRQRGIGKVEIDTSDNSYGQANGTRVNTDEPLPDDFADLVVDTEAIAAAPPALTDEPFPKRNDSDSGDVVYIAHEEIEDEEVGLLA